jgi:Na+/proline symporter
MENTIYWLIGIVVAFTGIGLGMPYQGKVLLKPEDSKKIGKQLHKAGIIWIAIASLFLVVVLILQFSSLL